MRLNAKMTEAEKKARLNKIIQLRNLRFTFAEIGKRYEISSQRVQAIYKKHREDKETEIEGS